MIFYMSVQAKSKIHYFTFHLNCLGIPWVWRHYEVSRKYTQVGYVFCAAVTVHYISWMVLPIEKKSARIAGVLSIFTNYLSTSTPSNKPKSFSLVASLIKLSYLSLLFILPLICNAGLWDRFDSWISNNHQRWFGTVITIMFMSGDREWWRTCI